MGSEDDRKSKKKRKRRHDSDDSVQQKKSKKHKKDKKKLKHSKSKSRLKSSPKSKKENKVGEKLNGIAINGPTGSRNEKPSEKKNLCKPRQGQAKEKRSMIPMTKEEYEKQQSIVRRVYDADTGRTRLVKGDGEIIEEIVSKAQHKAINKKATSGDGQYFQSAIGLHK